MAMPRWLSSLSRRLRSVAHSTGRTATRTRNKIKDYPPLFQTYRVIVTIVGGIVVLAGLIMCVVPGPGIATIILGLLILSTEFSWALRLMNWVKRRTRQAIDVAKEKAWGHRGVTPDGNDDDTSVNTAENPVEIVDNSTPPSSENLADVDRIKGSDISM
ncbi:MAG: PGPGW domain-containing protein [Propionibacteriaceae bacterium]|jgi:uncharacterized protein (TIGR02611 family)|nr:PGPGW domain-containing protein [Propionibacteriaceae bacterium]